MLGFKSYKTSASILSGVEAMHMLKKEQIDLQDQSVQNQNIFQPVVWINCLTGDSVRNP